MTLYKVTSRDLKSAFTVDSLSVQYKVGESVESEAKNSPLFYYTEKPNYVSPDHILWECEVYEPSNKIVLCHYDQSVTKERIDYLWNHWLSNWNDKYPIKLERKCGVIIPEYHPIWLIDTVTDMCDIGVAKRIKLIKEVT